jgi:DNA polymerase (family 10)
MSAQPTNAHIADMLERIADLLDTQDANPFRVRAYREGAQTIRDLDYAAAHDIRSDHFDRLIALPTIGEGIAAVIGEYVSSGKSSLLEQLEAKASPGDAFARIPGIGDELAERIAGELDIETLPELEAAAHDGRLATVEGFGERRVEAVRTALSGMLSQSAQRTQRRRTNGSKHKKDDQRPSVELLLRVDEEYRQKAEQDKLHKIAPRRFNPKNEAWLPVLNTKYNDWKFTALFSNTAQAHKLGKTDDWVVIYYEKDGDEQQNTVVTETHGALKGKRVVRGRSLENQRYYEAATSSKQRIP